MKNIVLLTVGLITGTVAGVFIAPHLQETQQETPPAVPPVAAEPEITSPFAPIASGSNLANATIKTTQPRLSESSKAITQDEPDTNINNVKHYREVIAYLQYIDTTDTETLKHILSQLDDSRFNSNYNKILGTAIFQRFGEIDIDAALDHALAAIARRDNDHYSPWSHEALTTLAALDPDFIRERIEQLGDNQRRSALNNALYEGMAESNPQQLARQLLADGLDTFAKRHSSHGFGMAISAWAMQDPESAWYFLQTEVDEEDQLAYAEQVLYMWAEKDPDTAFIEIEALLNNSSSTANPEQYYMLTELYMARLSKTDPNAAYQWALSQQDPRVKENAVMSVLYNWDDNDIEGHNSFISQMDPELSKHYKPMAISVLTQKLASSDPRGAMQLAEQLPVAESFDAKIMIVSQWAHTEPDAAAEWLFNLPDTPENQSLIQNASYSFLYGDPESAKRMFARLPPDIQSELTTIMIETLGPEEAAAWLNNQSNPAVQQIGSTMLNAMDSNTDTSTALNSVANIQNRNTRESMLFNTVIERAVRDPAGVETWINTTSLLSNEEREMIKGMTDQSSQYGMPFDSGYPDVQINPATGIPRFVE